MSKGEKTRAYIIEQAAPVFNRKGYKGTSLSDIMEATALTKGSLRQRLADALATAPTAAGKLAAFTGYYRTNWKKMFERGGCPIQNASVEADDNFELLKGQVQQSIVAWAKTITVIIKDGQQNGELNVERDPKKYAYTIITVLEGGIMLSKIMNDKNLLFQALDRIDKIVEEEIKMNYDQNSN